MAGTAADVAIASAAGVIDSGVKADLENVKSMLSLTGRITASSSALTEYNARQHRTSDPASTYGDRYGLEVASKSVRRGKRSLEDAFADGMRGQPTHSMR